MYEKRKSLFFAGIFALTALVMLFVLQRTPMSAKADENTYVNLYKNDTYVERLDTVNQAFDKMTDASADYKLEMSGSQMLSGYEQWPSVKSITITVPNAEDDTNSGITTFELESANTTIHCDVHLKGWVQLFGSQNGENGINTLHLGNHSLIVDDAGGHYVYIYKLRIKGDADSQIVFNGGAQGFSDCIINVPTLIESSTGFFHLNAGNNEKSIIDNWYIHGTWVRVNGTFDVNGDVEINNLISIFDPLEQPDNIMPILTDTIRFLNTTVHLMEKSAYP